MLDRPGKMDFSSQNGLVFRHLVLSPTNDSWQAINLPDAHPVAMACEDAAAGILYRRLDGQPAWFDEARTAKIAWSPGMARSPVNAIKKDRLGRIWVGANNGLFLWNGTDLVRQPPTKDGDESVQSLLPGPDGGVWLGSAHHLRRFADGGWSCSLLLSATNAAAGDLADFAPQFANSHGGVWLWHPLKKLLYVSADGKISRPGLAGQQLSGAPLCWLEDQEGNVWLGLNEGGLVRLRPRIFHPLWPDPFGDSPVACSVCEDARGVVWFGGGGRQVWRWEHDAFTSFQPPSGPSFEETKVTPADGGDLWVGTVKNGLLRLHEGKYSRPFAALQIGTVARCLLPDRRGGLWIGSEFGLFHWDDNNGLKAFNPSFARPQANP